MKFAAVVLAAALFPAAAQEPLEVLRRTAETYRKAHSYAVSGIDTLERVARGEKRSSQRRFRAYRLESAMRVDFQDGGRRLTDGKFEWIYSAQTGKYTKRAAPGDSRGRRALRGFYYDYEGIADFVKQADFVTPPGKDGFLIEVTYEMPETIKNYWIDPAYTVRREISHPATIGEPRGAVTVRLTRTVVFRVVTLDAPLEASLFAAPPDGL